MRFFVKDNYILSEGEIVVTNENSTGRPLANKCWLETHHRAKLIERIAFAKKITRFKPKNIVDLGCASGLWLEVLNDVFPNECEFIGIDSDDELLSVAMKRSKSWKRKTSFLKFDIESETSRIPSCDLILAFNVFPYIHNLDSFITTLSSKIPTGILIVRQYDGASIRFGPMPTSKRQEIEFDLRVATENSQKFNHYDLDRTFNILKHSSYKHCHFEFELFERTSPFTEDFLPYYNETLSWTCQFLSDSSTNYLKSWINDDIFMQTRYFYEVDLVAILS